MTSRARFPSEKLKLKFISSYAIFLEKSTDVIGSTYIFFFFEIQFRYILHFWKVYPFPSL